MHISKYVLKISSKQIHRTLEIEKIQLHLKFYRILQHMTLRYRNVIPQDQITSV